MPWWGWVVVGALMLSAELAFVDAQFYLVFLGVAALAVGLIGLAGTDLPIWLQWLLFAALSLVFFVGFRKRLYRTLRSDSGETVPENVEAEHALAIDEIAPGGRGKVELRGSRWTAVNESDRAIASGSSVRVINAEGVVLHVRPEG